MICIEILRDKMGVQVCIYEEYISVCVCVCVCVRAFVGVCVCVPV